MKVDAPTTFFVTSFSPMELSPDTPETIHITGVNLGNVKRVKVQNVFTGEFLEPDINKRNNEIIEVEIHTEVPPNTVFFIVLEGDDESWWPVGPMRRLSTLSTKQ